MPRKPRPPCSVPGCPELTARGGRCPEHQTEADAQRGTPGGSAYGPRWPRIRRAYLYAHPWCVLCARQATTADHFAESRRSLVARGVADPDAWSRLRPLCTQCHSRETAVHQPGGWASERVKPVRGPGLR
ncbi:HNH endonuclease [Streptomyces tateyamensis]|uniref:HNH endonuclease n=1 Tax=Streptomyces tateyamensis TaxID=565073 RepID=A0A2V4N877_9ACTN|nr:HNH endonuclease [Streptomyces tateyamensis]